MPTSIISCNLTRDETRLADFRVRTNNGTVGAYRLKYKIEMAGPVGPKELIEQATTAGAPDRLPKIWDTYSFEGDSDPNSYVKHHEIDREPKSKRHYYVTVTWEPLEPGEPPGDGGAPIDSHPVPTERKPRFHWERQVTSSLQHTDTNNYVILNYTNTLHDDLIEHDRTKAILVGEINSSSIAAAINLERKYANAVNSIAWTFQGVVIEPRAALIREVVSGQVQNEGAFTFIPTQFRIAFADIGSNWDDVLPEMSQTHFTKTGGNYDVDPATGLRKITSAGRSVPLAADGTRLPDGQQVLTRAWPTRKQADFNLLTILNT